MLEIRQVAKKNKTSILLLPIGGLFKFEDSVFMKTDEVGTGHSSVCVDLATGDISRISQSHEVTPIHNASMEVFYD